MLTSVDLNNTPQGTPPSIFTRQTMTMPTALQGPQLSPNSFPQVPMNYSPRYVPQQQQQQSVYQLDQPSTTNQMYRTDNEFQTNQIVGTIQSEARGFFEWLLRF